METSISNQSLQDITFDYSTTSNSNIPENKISMNIWPLKKNRQKSSLSDYSDDFVDLYKNAIKRKTTGTLDEKIIQQRRENKPKYSKNIDYKHLRSKVNQINLHLNKILKEEYLKKFILSQKIQNIEDELSSKKQRLVNHKKYRRHNFELEKKFRVNILLKKKCPFESCEKVYASENSLSYHMRIKHGCASKLDRVKYFVNSFF